MELVNLKNVQQIFQTENRHYNKYAFALFNDALIEDLFEAPAFPVMFFDKSVRLFSEEWQNPLVTFTKFSQELEEHTSLKERLFIVKWLIKYIDETMFDDIELDKILALLKTYKKRIETEIVSEIPAKLLVKDLREKLKTIMKEELNQLPEQLSKLDTQQRLNILCKLMPHVLPKVDSIRADKDEDISGFGSSLRI